MCIFLISTLSVIFHLGTLCLFKDWGQKFDFNFNTLIFFRLDKDRIILNTHLSFYIFTYFNRTQVCIKIRSSDLIEVDSCRICMNRLTVDSQSVPLPECGALNCNFHPPEYVASDSCPNTFIVLSTCAKIQHRWIFSLTTFIHQ